MTTYMEFAARGRNSLWRWFLTPVAALAALVLVLACLQAVHLLPRDFAAELRRASEPARFFTDMAVMFGVLLAALIGAIVLIHRKRPGDIIGNWSWALCLQGAGLWAVVQSAIALLDYLIAPRGFTLTMTAGTSALALCAFASLAVQTFAEEFLFRGYVTQGFLLATRRPLPAAVLSGTLFGALHIWNGVPQAAGAIAFGILCSLIAIRTGGIAFTFGLHLVNNYFGAVAVVSATDVFNGSPGIVLQNTPQFVWSDILLMTLALLATFALVAGRGAVAGRLFPGWPAATERP